MNCPFLVISSYLLFCFAFIQSIIGTREYGSGGRYVGKMIAENLGIKFYDKDIIVKLAEQTGLSEEYIENNEQKRNAISNFHKSYAGVDNADELFFKEDQIIKEIADKESCVIIGRCAFCKCA